MNNKLIYVVAVILVFVGGVFIGTRVSDENASVSMPMEQSGEAGEKDPVYYRNPMNPAITSPVPAKDEMGMDYIPVYAAGAKDQVAGTVTIDPVTIQAMGVRSVEARTESLSRVIRAPGRVDYDEERLNRLHPKTQGWIEELRIRKTGQFVKFDEILLSIYSPNLMTSQEEYLLTLQNLETARRSSSEMAIERAGEIARSSRQRLVLLDVPEHQIVELEQSRQVKRTLHIHSPFSGVVTNVGVREGKFVTPTTELFMIADLSHVWAYVDVYEHELSWVKVGDKAEMKVAAVPGRTFSGEITHIYPYMEPKSRTVKVRLEFQNKEGLLKPEMFASVRIFTSTQESAIVVPSEAIVRSGTREQIFIVRPGGKFEPREVTIGLESDGLTQVLRGVKAGERVVTSAQFLIDSESKLNEATAKMLEVQDDMEMEMEGTDTESHDMHDMEGTDTESHDMHDMHDMEGTDTESHDMHDMHDMEGIDMENHDEPGHNMEGHQS